MQDIFSLAELSDSFHRFEVENRLFDIQVRDRCIWDYLRYDIFEQLVVRAGSPYVWWYARTRWSDAALDAE